PPGGHAPGPFPGVAPAAPVEAPRVIPQPPSNAPPAPACGQEDGAPTDDASPSSMAENDPLFPEQQLPGGHLALAVNSRQGQIVAGPAMDLRLLEAGRRRVAGDTGLVHRWPLQFAGPAEDLRGPSAAVFDLAFAAEPNAFGQYSLAAAGGDALLNMRPGAVTL